MAGVAEVTDAQERGLQSSQALFSFWTYPVGLEHTFSSILPCQHPEGLSVEECLSLPVTPTYHRLLRNFWVLSNQERT